MHIRSRVNLKGVAIAVASLVNTGVRAANVLRSAAKMLRREVFGTERGSVVGGLPELTAVQVIQILGGLVVASAILTAFIAQRTVRCYLGMSEIAQALDQWHNTYQAYPATGPVNLAMFTPSDGEQNIFLKSVPTDPANPSGTYTLTNLTANNVDDYELTCPATNHPSITLIYFPGHTATSGTLNYQKSVGWFAS